MNTDNISRQTNLRDYWKILVRQRWVVIAFFSICAVTVSLGTFLMKPLYRATTNVLIEGENSNILRAEEASSGTSFDIFENYLETQMSIIKSRSVAGEVFEEFKLDTTERYRKRRGLGKFFKVKFSDDILLVRLTGTRMVAVSILNPDAKMAADVANRLAEVYAQDNLKRRALTFIRNQRMASMNAEFLRLQARLDALSTQLGPMHPDMVALRNEIRTMAKRIETERVQAQAPEGKALSEDQVLLEDTLMKIQENSVLSSSRMNNIVIVDRAIPPKEIDRPNRLFNIALGIVFGLIGGVFLAFFVDYLDDSIKSYEDLKPYLGSEINFLGTVFLEKPKSHSPETVDKLVALQSESSSAEAYRLIRTAIWWYVKNEKVIKDVAILSPGPGEGKTLIASNLSIALSQLKSKVLLVDTDIRRGRLHKVYGVPNDKGLAHYLTDSLPLAEVIKKTDIPNLFLVTCGASVINTSQLFTSAVMKNFIRQVREQFDIVIYDTAPLAVISDTSILISQLGGTILTVRSGMTVAGVIPKSLKLIKESGTTFIGVILNGTSSGDDPYYNRYYQQT